MSERLVPRRLLRTALAAELISLAAMGYAHFEGDDNAAVYALSTPHGAIERCFDKAQPDIKPKEQRDSPLIKLNVQAKSTAQRGVEIYHEEFGPEQNEKIKKAVVMIDGENMQGSGFLTDNSKGERIAITAGHVLANERLKDIKVYDDTGASTRPVDACIVYDNDGQFYDRTNMTAPEADVAVLTLPKQFGKSVLTMSGVAPYRGQWVTFKNYQIGSKLGAQAFYTGMVSDMSSSFDLEVTSGLDVSRYNGPESVKNYICMPGGSGGPVVNGSGEVIGIMTGASAWADTVSPSEFKEKDGLSIEGSTDSSFPVGVDPHDCTVMRTNLIQKVVYASGQLKP